MHELNNEHTARVAGGTLLLGHAPFALPLQWYKPTPEPWIPLLKGNPQPLPWGG